MIGGLRLAAVRARRAIFVATVMSIGCLGIATRSDAQEWLPVDEFVAEPGERLSPSFETLHEPASTEIVSEEIPLGELRLDEIPTCHCHGGCAGRCSGVNRDPGHPAKPKHEKPGDIDKGDCPSVRYRMDDCLRTGDPNCVYNWAKPSITDEYSAWYVGGGAAFKGRGRTAEEGTWGLDYDGLFGHARTWLNYTCGKRQGGEGAYQTDHVPLKKKLSALH